jgi:multicomponent Na+:H+ antiporter subunit E
MQQESKTLQCGSFYLRYRGIALQSALLMAIWLILSGHFDFLHIFYGVVSVAFVVWLNYRLHGLPLSPGELPGCSFINIPRLLVYLVWLQWQIIQSALYVAYVVLHPRVPISPALVRFKSKQPNVLARVILANSITLTPGTITVQVNEDEFIVHALTKDTAGDLVSGEMEARVARLYLPECRNEDVCTDVEMITSGRGR